MKGERKMNKIYAICWKVFGVIFALDFCLGFIHGYYAVLGINYGLQDLASSVLMITTPFEVLTFIFCIVLTPVYLVMRKRQH